MEANGDCVLSIATASPGVLDNAPAISPTILGVSTSKRYLHATPVRQADKTNTNVTSSRLFPLLRNEWKKPGPACMPMVKINKTSPKLPSSFGMTTPQCPKASAINITADTSSDNPAIRTRPSIKPNATIRNTEKYDDCNKSIHIIILK